MTQQIDDITKFGNKAFSDKILIKQSFNKPMNKLTKPNNQTNALTS